jgi:DNA-binding HxlR family transcriptional regulator
MVSLGRAPVAERCVRSRLFSLDAGMSDATAGLLRQNPAAPTMLTSARREAENICPADVVLNIVKVRWATHIMKRIGDHGALHFAALQRSIPAVSRKVLTDQLRHLERAGILQRQLNPPARRGMPYSLTSRGRELKVVLDSLEELGARWQREDANRGCSRPPASLPRRLPESA